MLPIFIALFTLNYLLTPAAAQEWSYDTVQRWARDFPRCGGQRQSPINIETRRTRPILNDPVIFIDFDRPFRRPLRMVNNGHTANIPVGTTVSGRRPRLLLSRVLYEVESFHWHWPAEHAVDGNRYDAERHTVARNLRYNTMELALQREDGILVLADFVSIANRTTGPLATNDLDPVLTKLPAIQRYNTEVSLSADVTLAGLLGRIDTSRYYRYRGSLTTPPCNEVVEFIIFQDLKFVASQKLQNFYRLQDRNGVPKRNTARPLQNLGGRTVFCQCRR